ncbi:MAG: hypothetical protein HY326_10090, partial [Chloroflexi bacterium]|nr:hypothetical protein [Chloroflexota bacterium]
MESQALISPELVVRASESEKSAEIQGRWLTVARAAWIGLFLITLGLYAMGVVEVWKYLNSVCEAVTCGINPAEVEVLRSWGISTGTYAL